MENYLSQIKNIVSKSSTNKIYVLGKGPTAGKIKTKVLEDGIVININDSERIYPGDFCLAHSLWAHESIKENGYKAKTYFSSRQLPPEVNGFKIPYEPDTFDSLGREISEIEDSDFAIMDFLFISAVKLSLLISDLRQQKMSVYFIGFDFYNSEPSVIEDYSHHNSDYTEMVLKTQESIFKSVKSYFRNSDKLELVHVGNRAFSDVSISVFSRVDLKQSRRNWSKRNRELYYSLLDDVSNNKPIVVAELTNNHIGDENRLRAMVRLAKEAGADVIKVQKREVDTFYTEKELKARYPSPFGETFRDYRLGVELDEKLFDVLIDECLQNEVFWYLSILDYPSYKYVEKYNLPLLKLPSTISNHQNFLKRISTNFNEDLVISTGFTDLSYEEFVLKHFTNDRNLFLLQCTSSYPAPPEACQLAVIRHYHELKQDYPRLIPGYSSHDIGSVASMMALSAGAMMIEKHVKLGDLDWVHFDGVALDLTTAQFRNFIQDIKRAQMICGNSEKEIHEVEDHKYMPNLKSN